MSNVTVKNANGEMQLQGGLHITSAIEVAQLLTKVQKQLTTPVEMFVPKLRTREYYTL